MPDQPQQQPDTTGDGKPHEDGPLPSASDDEVLDETARLARGGRKALEADPKEPKPASTA